MQRVAESSSHWTTSWFHSTHFYMRQSWCSFRAQNPGSYVLPQRKEKVETPGCSFCSVLTWSDQEKALQTIFLALPQHSPQASLWTVVPLYLGVTSNVHMILNATSFVWEGERGWPHLCDQQQQKKKKEKKGRNAQSLLLLIFRDSPTKRKFLPDRGGFHRPLQECWSSATVHVRWCYLR